MSIAQPHTAKAAYLTCIDERLEAADHGFMTSVEGGTFHAALAGGALAFLVDETRAAALKQITLAYAINRVTDVYIESHMNCGAYGAEGVSFADEAAERKRLMDDLVQAAGLVKAALLEAGAAEGEVAIHLRVVSATGELLAAGELLATGELLEEQTYEQ